MADTDSPRQQQRRRRRDRESPRLDKISVIPSPRPDGTWLVLVAVADQYNNPLQGVPADFIRGGSVATKVTDSQGRAEHTVPSGKVTVRVSASYTENLDLRRDTRPPKPPDTAPGDDMENWWRAIVRGWQDGRRAQKETRQ